MMYICTPSNDTCRKYEKSLKKYVVKEELKKIKKEYGTDRRTHFLDDENLTIEVNPVIEEIVQDEYVILTQANTLKAIQPKNYSLAQKTLGANAHLHEIPKSIVWSLLFLHQSLRKNIFFVLILHDLRLRLSTQ